MGTTLTSNEKKQQYSCTGGEKSNQGDSPLGKLSNSSFQVEKSRAGWFCLQLQDCLFQMVSQVRSFSCLFSCLLKRCFQLNFLWFLFAKKILDNSLELNTTKKPKWESFHQSFLFKGFEIPSIRQKYYLFSFSVSFLSCSSSAMDNPSYLAMSSNDNPSWKHRGKHRGRFCLPLSGCLSQLVSTG